LRDEITAPGAPGAQNRLVALARLGKAHGINGEMKLELLGRTGEALEGARRVYVGRTQLDARRMEIAALRGAPPRLLLKLRGVDSPEAARALSGARVFLPRREFPEAAEGEYYWVDLVGLRVKADAEPLGTVAEIIETPAFDVLVVRDPGRPGEERLIPFTGASLREVRLAEGLILVEPPSVWEAESGGTDGPRRKTGRSGGGKGKGSPGGPEEGRPEGGRPEGGRKEKGRP